MCSFVLGVLQTSCVLALETAAKYPQSGHASKQASRDKTTEKKGENTHIYIELYMLYEYRVVKNTPTRHACIFAILYNTMNYMSLRVPWLKGTCLNCCPPGMFVAVNQPNKSANNGHSDQPPPRSSTHPQQKKHATRKSPSPSPVDLESPALVAPAAHENACNLHTVVELQCCRIHISWTSRGNLRTPPPTCSILVIRQPTRAYNRVQQ